ncbi:MAG TPA: FAD-dependent oxidoreductase [Planctomycetota bacterium]|nr:FAD-dependent oxidoreductase [Planctomycetota bacterium]
MNAPRTDYAPEPSLDEGAMKLGLPGYVFADLYRPARLRDLFVAFLNDLDRRDPTVALKYREILEKGDPVREEETWIACHVGPHVSAFVGALFGVEGARKFLSEKTRQLHVLMRVRKDFTRKRVLRRGAFDDVAETERAALEKAIRPYVEALGEPEAGEHPEFAFARAVALLLDLEIDLKAGGAGGDAAARTAAVDPVFGTAVDGPARLAALNGVLDRLARFGAWAKRFDPHGVGRDWVVFRTQEPLHFDRLVPERRPRADLPELLFGPEHALRRRTGFDLTDPRMAPREVMGEIETCLFCHERDKDSCAKGFPEKDGTYRKNPLGIPLEGCPLDEHISEMHWLRDRGDAIGALAAVMINNPMCPGTGHRICNDCMKACIFQKQEPVNIPQIETSVLTDVLGMPYGPEIYGLFTRWNPLNVRRPYQLPLNGKKVLVVGLGPAGYTLAHYLANEGFGVVAVDGLKIEPLADDLAGRGFRPVKDWASHVQRLGGRTPQGFGGVSEYGITVRWDKNFLFLIYLTLARRQGLRIFGGVRFGGTLTLKDAAELGFDHVAVATGAGKPTLVDMKNNLLRGVRQASDFLMALQLTGAFKESSLANLQASLPAVVIGGGLTAIDTATELFAYYPLMCERVAARVALLKSEGAWCDVEARLAGEERRQLEEYLVHAAAFGAERARAEEAGEAPNFVPLVRKFGGVTLCYRKSLQDSPAYRLNHEEVIKALEEGIGIAENLSPTECVADETGAIRAIRFERQALKDGKWRGSGEIVEMPARTVMVAAGTSPNTIYEKERPGTFRMQPKGGYFEPHQATFEDGRPRVAAGGPPREAFFTSYVDVDTGLTVSYYGDNHPAYAGNVVKAMASAKNGFPKVVALFATRIRNLDPAAQAARDRSFAELCSTLDDGLRARVVRVERLTATIVEVVLHAPFQARKFEPGQFYRLQDFESQALTSLGLRTAMEGLALTGAWTDKDKGLLSLIILEMGGSSSLCALLKPGQEVVCMGPTGAPTEIPSGETVLLAGGGLGNAVLFSIAKALKEAGSRVLYFAGYKNGADLFKRDEIEAATDLVVYSTDMGVEIAPRRPQDRHFRGNIVQAMVAYAKGAMGETPIPLDQVDRIIAIGSDRMMAAVKAARHDPTTLGPLLKRHVAVGSINSPMQCMMKEVCAQCLQRHVDPVTGQESFIFSCFNQDQELDVVDWNNLNERLKANNLQEKLSNKYLDYLFEKGKLERA